MRFLGHLGAAARGPPGRVLPGHRGAGRRRRQSPLAWLSSRTVEAAGLKLLATIERDGTPRDYYAHLTR